VGIGAIVVVGAEREIFCSTAPDGVGTERGSLSNEPLAGIEIMGRSMLERTVERFVQAGIEAVTVMVATEMSAMPLFRAPLAAVAIQPVSDVCAAISEKLKDYADRGIEHTFVMSANVYTETDLLDLFHFHRESQQSATRARDGEGRVDLWVVDCAKAQQCDFENLLARAEQTGASYFIREYVNRLRHPRDLRRIAADALSGRCAIRPSGREIKPGIWVDDGAEVHRRARIVAPAYIGRGSRVREDTLITRCSSIEKGCCVDYGTVIEDSSILADTHIGVCLDVCHAVVNGSSLLSLGRDVVLEISDPSVLRSARPVRKEVREVEARDSSTLADQPAPSPSPKAWQFGTNPIQG
jgi:NDP-sugar pyrophosphorylase family protein